MSTQAIFFFCICDLHLHTNSFFSQKKWDFTVRWKMFSKAKIFQNSFFLLYPCVHKGFTGAYLSTSPLLLVWWNALDTTTTMAPKYQFLYAWLALLGLNIRLQLQPAALHHFTAPYRRPPHPILPWPQRLTFKSAMNNDFRSDPNNSW